MKLKRVIIYFIFFSLILSLLLLKITGKIFDDDFFLWILYPTVFIVQFLTGYAFSYFENTGYVSYDNIITISKSCAGINLFILTNLIGIYLISASRSELHKKALYLIPNLIMSYIFTIITNALRISFSIYFEPVKRSVPFLIKAKNWVHYGIGTFLFIFSLLVYYFILKRGLPWIKKKIKEI